jgi:hypothetical protein
MNHPLQGAHPLRESAREWQKIQVGVLGFVGVCGLLPGAKDAAKPAWVQESSAVSALAGLVLALLSVLLIAGVAYPVTTRSITASAASRRLTAGIVVTFVAVGLTALAALSGWWPQGAGADRPQPPQLVVRTDASSACGSLLQSGSGAVDLEIDGKRVRVPLDRLKSIEVTEGC